MPVKRRLHLFYMLYSSFTNLCTYSLICNLFISASSCKFACNVADDSSKSNYTPSPDFTNEEIHGTTAMIKITIMNSWTDPFSEANSDNSTELSDSIFFGMGNPMLCSLISMENDDAFNETGWLNITKNYGFDSKSLSILNRLCPKNSSNSSTTQTVPLIDEQTGFIELTLVMQYLTNSGAGIFGVIANALSLCLFVRMTKQKMHVFYILIGVSIADDFCLISQLDNAAYSWFSVSLLGMSPIPCKILHWLQDAAKISSAYFVLMYTFERFVSVTYPMKVAVICTKYHLLLAMFGTVLVSVALAGYDLKYYVLNINYCTRKSRDRNVYNVLDLVILTVIGSFLPYSAIAVLNGLIIYALYKHHKENASLLAAARGAKPGSETNHAKKQNSLTIMLIVVSTYSLMITIPTLVMYMIDPFGKMFWKYFIFETWAQDILPPWNYCANFFFYIIGGRIFRVEGIKMIKSLLRIKSTGKYLKYLTLSNNIMYWSH